MSVVPVLPMEGWEWRTNGDFLSAIHTCQWAAYIHLETVLPGVDDDHAWDFLRSVVNHVC